MVSGLVSEENALKISSSCTDLSNIKSPFGGVEEEDEVGDDNDYGGLWTGVIIVYMII